MWVTSCLSKLTLFKIFSYCFSSVDSFVHHSSIKPHCHSFHVISHLNMSLHRKSCLVTAHKHHLGDVMWWFPLDFWINIKHIAVSFSVLWNSTSVVNYGLVCNLHSMHKGPHHFLFISEKATASNPLSQNQRRVASCDPCFHEKSTSILNPDSFGSQTLTTKLPSFYTHTHITPCYDSLSVSRFLAEHRSLIMAHATFPLPHKP